MPSWSDYDNDDDMDLMVVGEWMGITVFQNENGQFTEKSEEAGFAATSGWWNAIEAPPPPPPADIDGDGDTDFIVGNHGLNSRFHASTTEPISCYINDFDHNGSAEQILSLFNEGKSYIQPLRHDLVIQLPHLKKKYLKYESYKNQTINDVFSEEELKGSIVHKVVMLESVSLINNGKGTFQVEPLPLEAQVSPIYAIEVADFDADGKEDVFLGGNLHRAKPEVGRYDASYGILLKGLGHADFEAVSMQESGLALDGEIRDAKIIRNSMGSVIMIAKNDAPIEFFEF